jgi:HAD superfamily, subfamily IIIB (Acid phosphatase)
MVPNCIIVDLDGTLASCADRQGSLKARDWDTFHEAGCYAKPILHTVLTVNHLGDAGYRIVVLTGRNEKYRNGTEAWLHKHIPRWNRLIMRKDRDFRSSVEIKGEILANVDPKHVLAVFEDQDDLASMARHMGFTVFQVSEVIV